MTRKQCRSLYTSPVFTGDGSSRSVLEAQAAASGVAGRIHFLGMVKRAELLGLLHEADPFISTSTIAYGLPVAAAAGDAFEGTLRNGLTGQVVA